MSEDSDTPHVKTGLGSEESKAVIQVNMGNWTPRSGIIVPGNVSKVVFEPVEDNSVISRFITNVNADKTLWVNFLMGAAVPNFPNCVPIPPLATLQIPSRGYVTIISDSEETAYYTAGEA